jgi:orotidine-5'-phosphate decarboxylase
LIQKQINKKLILNDSLSEKSKPIALYKTVIEKIAGWGTPDNLMFVTGATKASDFEGIRNIIPNNFLLVPGVGAQGGSLKDVSKYGLNKDCGLLVNASRAIIYASEKEDFAVKARIVAQEYQQEMSRYLLNNTI